MISLARYAQRVVDGASPPPSNAPASHRLSSMCMGIADFDCSDCLGCSHDCHEVAS